jgi:hypothetical protein
MTFRVIIQPVAEVEVQKIYDWLAERSPQGAVTWYEAYIFALDALRSDPQSRPIALDAPVQGFPVHELLFQTRRGKPYRILFIVIEDARAVRVLHVRGHGQRPLDEK